METADLSIALYCPIVGIDDYVVDLTASFSKWEDFYAYALSHKSGINWSYLVVKQDNQEYNLDTVLTVFEMEYQLANNPSFRVADIMERYESMNVLHHDLAYAQTFGRWAVDHCFHPNRFSQSVTHWLVDNGAAVYLWPNTMLNLENLSVDGLDLVQVSARLYQLNENLICDRLMGLQPDELTQIMKHSIQYLLDKESLSACRRYIPEEFQSVYAELDRNAYELMSNYAQARFERMSYPTMDNEGLSVQAEFFLGEGMTSPLKEHPIQLSPTQWHQLCSSYPEMIQFHEVPQEVLQQREFWFPVEDLIGKGRYLAGEEHPSKSYDEQEVFGYMPAEMRNQPEVVTLLLRSGAVSPDLFDKEVALFVYRQFEPSLYATIPEAFRAMPELGELALRAVQQDPYLINSVPDNQLSPVMFKEVIPQDLSLLRRFDHSFVKHVPQLEFMLVQAIRNMETMKQDALSDLAVDEGSKALALDDAKSHALTHIPAELRTAAVCEAAIQLHPGNRQFVPQSLQQTVGEMLSEPKRTHRSRFSR